MAAHEWDLEKEMATSDCLVPGHFDLVSHGFRLSLIFLWHVTIIGPFVLNVPGLPHSLPPSQVA